MQQPDDVLTLKEFMKADSDEVFRLSRLWRLVALASKKGLAHCREDFFKPLRTERGALQLMWLSEDRGAVYVAQHPHGSRLSLASENGVETVVVFDAPWRPTRPVAVAAALDLQAKEKMILRDTTGLDVCAGQVVGVTADAARYLWPELSGGGHERELRRAAQTEALNRASPPADLVKGLKWSDAHKLAFIAAYDGLIAAGMGKAAALRELAAKGWADKPATLTKRITDGNAARAKAQDRRGLLRQV